MIDLRRLHPRYWNLRLIWDVFMVWAALANLTLILFDLTYLLMRPYYLRWVPPLVRVYDPVKGIAPHPLTEDLLKEAAEVRELFALDPDSPGLEERLRRLERLTLAVLESNPFDRSGQARTMEVLRALIAQEVDVTTLEMSTPEGMEQAVEAFWTPDPEELEQRLDAFDLRLRPLLEINYFREVTLSGRLVDHFWLLDLPFLTLFIVEFGVRWSLAVHRRQYPRWYFFPIFNWYDLLGLIPIHELRVFRLFRVASIYMRLRRSEMSRVGKDVLSRAVAYVSNIVAEEISDVVALRILSETQDEIREGLHMKILDRTVERHREAVEQVVVEQVRDVLTSDPIQSRIRELLRMNLDNAVEQSQALSLVPLSSTVMRPLVRSVGTVLLDTTLDTVRHTLDSEEGRQVARDLVREVLTRVVQGPWRDELDQVAREVSVDVIEQMKDAVAVKKWARPEPEDP